MTTTDKAKELVSLGYTKMELSEELGVTRPTFDSRLKGKTKWKILEVKWINKLYKEKWESKN